MDYMERDALIGLMQANIQWIPIDDDIFSESVAEYGTWLFKPMIFCKLTVIWIKSYHSMWAVQNIINKEN